MSSESLKNALIANLVIALIKFVVGFFSGSAAMISEGIHSLADSFNQILLGLGIKGSKKKADLEHQFGYAKRQFFWAFVVAILIFGVSGTIAFLEGLKIILNPEEHEIKADKLYLNLIVLFAAMLLEGFAFKTAYGEAKKFQKESGEKSVLKALDKMQDPVLSSIFAEDALALIGLIIAFIGISLTSILEMPIIDGYTSMAIGLVLGTGGLVLAKENKTYLIGRAVNLETQEDISKEINSFEEVEKIKTLRTMLLGPKEMILAVDIEFKTEFEDDHLAEVIDKIENHLSELFEQLSPDKIFIEIQ